MDRWIVPSVVKSFFKHDAFNAAASISFCGLLSIIPLIMLVLSAAGFVLGSFDQVFDQLVKTISELIPWGREVFLANLASMMEKRSHLGIFGIAFLIFAATLLVSSIEMAFDRIFRTEKSRNFFHSRLLGVGMIFLVSLLLFLPTVANLVQVALQRFGIDIPLADFMAGRIYLFLVLFTGYLMIVVIIPNRKVYLRYALVGAVFFSAGIGITRFLFQWYLSFAITRYDVIYGSLSAVILAVVWMYYFSLVLLLSAEIVSELQHRKVFQKRTDHAERRKGLRERRKDVPQA